MASSASTANNQSYNWPDDWPIQAEDPSSELLEQPALVPGNTLRSCSGSDVHWARGASSRSTVKYLAFLPGVLSLKPQENPTVVAKKKEENIEQVDIAEHNGSMEVADSAKTESVREEDPETNKSEAARSTSKETPQPAILGRLKRPNSSSAATLILNGGLELTGKHLKTSGKFLLLTMQPRKKIVTCKHMFDSVLVFGDATMKKHQYAQQKVGYESRMDHYGGSCRTVDGGGGGASNGSLSTMVEFQKTSTPVASKTPIASRTAPSTDKDLLSSTSSSSSDEEYKVAAAANAAAAVQSTTATIRRPSRAATQKPVRYSDALEFSSEGSRSEEYETMETSSKKQTLEESDHGSDGEESATVNGRKTNSQEQQPVQHKRKSALEREVVEIDDDGSDDYDVASIPHTAPAAKKARTVASRTKAAAPITKVSKQPAKRSRSLYNLPDSSEEDEDESDKGEPNGSVYDSYASFVASGTESPLTKKRAPSNRQNSSITSHVQEVDDSSSSKSEESMAEVQSPKLAPVRGNSSSTQKDHRKKEPKRKRSSADGTALESKYVNATEDSRFAKRASFQHIVLLAESKSTIRSAVKIKKTEEDSSSVSFGEMGPQQAKPKHLASMKRESNAYGSGKTDNSQAPRKTIGLPGQGQDHIDEGSDSAIDDNKKSLANESEFQDGRRAIEETETAQLVGAKANGRASAEANASEHSEVAARAEQSSGHIAKSNVLQQPSKQTKSAILEVVDLTHESESILEKVSKTGTGSTTKTGTTITSTETTRPTVIKKKELSEKAVMEQPMDGDRNSSKSKPKRRLTGFHSVFENLEPPTSHATRPRPSNAQEDTPQSVSSSNTHHSIPLRLRRSPPKPKKKLSLMDYAKDEGFL